MKMQTKPIVALASGALLLGALSQSAQAQGQFFPDPGTLVAGGIGVLADVNGNNTGSTALPVEYNVFIEPDSSFNYDYDLFNPTGDTAKVKSFSVSFDTTAPGALIAGPSSSVGYYGNVNSDNGITWQFNILGFNSIPAGSSSGLLSFSSDLPPILSGGNANGGGSAPAPWSTTPSGTLIPVPTVVPEPQTETLLATAFMLMAARATTFGSKLLRKK